MTLRKSDEFIADVERQFDWYLAKAGWYVAEQYLAAVEATCRLLAQHRNSARVAGSPIRAFVTGDSSLCSVPSKSMSSSTR
jgi:plasmid stabilization system protein ParE